MVPALLLLFGQTQLDAQSISLAVIVPTTIAGAVTHLRQGTVNRSLLLPLALGGAVGALAGSQLAVHAPAAVLTRLFGIFLVVNAVRLWPRRRTTSAAAD